MVDFVNSNGYASDGVYKHLWTEAFRRVFRMVSQETVWDNVSKEVLRHESMSVIDQIVGATNLVVDEFERLRRIKF